MKSIVYTLSLICLLAAPVFSQTANSSSDVAASSVDQMSKKEKKALKKELEKNSKEIKKQEPKSKGIIKIGEVPESDEVEEESAVKVDIQATIKIDDKSSGGIVKVHRGMSLTYGFLNLARKALLIPTNGFAGDDELDGTPSADKSWMQNQHYLSSSSFSSWDIFFNQYRLGQSPFWLRTGASLSFNVLDFGKSTSITMDFPSADDIGVNADVDASFTMKQSKLRTTYFEVPLELVFNSSNEGNKGITIGLGGYCGLRAKTSTLRVYPMSSDSTETIREIKINGFHTKLLSYGISARIGLGSFFAKGRFALSSYFDQGEKLITPDYQIFSATLGIDFL